MSIIDQLPGQIGWKDKRFRHIGCNKALADIYCLKHPNEIIGLRDDDLSINAVDINLFHEQDERVLNGEMIHYLHHYNHQIFTIIKKPLLNKNSHIDGIIYHCYQAPSIKNLNNNLAKLSKRELQCLHYIIQGKSARLIAEELRLSKRTIELYIDNIKNKFGCQNKSELIVLAFKNGYISNC